MEKGKLGSFSKIVGLVFTLQLLSLVAFAQDLNRVKVRERNDKTDSDVRIDNENCNANAVVQPDNYNTFNNTGIGYGIAASRGILGNPGFDPVRGGRSMVVREHTKSEVNEMKLIQSYAACMNNKGYQVDIYDDKDNLKFLY